jgi:hypothetical protein
VLRLAAPAIQLAPIADLADLPAPSAGGSHDVTIGGWDLTLYKTPGAIGVKADHEIASGTGLKAGIDIHLVVSNLRVVGDIPIVGGRVGSSGFRIEGIRSIAFQVAAGAKEGANDNRKLALEVPIEFKEPVVIGGIPATLSLKVKLVVETLFTTKNGILSGSGSYRLTGPIGYNGRTVAFPGFSVEKSFLSSLTGISVGNSGVVTSIEFKLGLGIGVPGAGAGPFASLIASMGIARSPAVGLVQCKSVTLQLTAKGGIGLDIAAPVKTAVETILSILKGASVTLPDDKEIFSKKFYDTTSFSPDVPACHY